MLVSALIDKICRIGRVAVIVAADGAAISWLSIRGLRINVSGSISGVAAVAEIRGRISLLRRRGRKDLALLIVEC